MISRYLQFQRIDDGSGKTERHAVKSVRHGDNLGVIKWYSRWRQYAFFPEAGCVFNRECLNEIATFCNGLMYRRRLSPKGGTP